MMVMAISDPVYTYSVGILFVCFLRKAPEVKLRERKYDQVYTSSFCSAYTYYVCKYVV